MKDSRDTELGIAMALLTVAAVLRLGGLGLHGLWLDEATSLQFAGHDLRGCLLAEVNNPPLHRLLLHGWIRLVGDGSDAALRALAALAGVLACAVTWRLARRVLAPRPALVALALFALDPYHLLLSQEVRAYSLLVLFAALGWLLHLDTRCPVPGRRPWRDLALAAVLLAGLHTHYQFAWVALAVGVHRLWLALRPARDLLPAGTTRLREALRLLWPLAVAALLTLPWIWVFLTHVTPQYRGYTTNLPGRLASLPFMLLLGESGVVRQYPETYGQAALRHLWLIVPFALALAPLLVLGVRWQWRRGRGSAARFLLFAGALPLGGLIVVFPWLPLFTARYLAFLMPVLCIALAAGAFATPGTRTPRWAGAALIGLLFALQLVSLGRYHLDPRFGREDWRGAAAWVTARERPGDVILFDHHYVELPFDRYHRGPARKLGVPGDPAGRAALFDRLEAAPPPRLFLVLSHHWDTGREPITRLARFLCPRATRIFRPSNGIEVHLFARCGDGL